MYAHSNIKENFSEHMWVHLNPFLKELTKKNIKVLLKPYKVLPQLSYARCDLIATKLHFYEDYYIHITFGKIFDNIE